MRYQNENPFCVCLWDELKRAERIYTVSDVGNRFSAERCLVLFYTMRLPQISSSMSAAKTAGSRLKSMSDCFELAWCLANDTKTIGGRRHVKPEHLTP